MVVVVILVFVWRSRRALGRRLTSVVTRLERPGHEPSPHKGLEGLLNRLEKAADDNVARVNEADAAMQRLAVALGQVEEAVVVWDDRGRVTFRNRRAEGEVDAITEQALNDLRDAALAGESKTQGLDLFGPPRRSLVVSAVPLDDGWRTIGAVAVVQDVSERRQLEAARRDFVANVGHELKTPVAALGLLAGTLTTEEDGVVARRLAARLRDEADRVSAIVDELLDLGRAEADQGPKREPASLAGLVGQAVARLRPIAQRAGVHLDVAELSDDLRVMAEERLLLAAIAHLLDNAVKYSARGGAVGVSAGVDGGWVSLVVRDQGIGIPPREVDRIFERFYRTEAARKHATGTGLGLSIVRHVASSHGGSVDVESTEGEGSVFVLRLPAAGASMRWSAAS